MKHIELLNEFQDLSKRTLDAKISDRDSYMNYGMGLVGESGEVTELLKKALFHGHELNKNKLKEELGDVLFYIAALATTAGISVEEIANYNIDKLKRRYPDGFSQERSINRSE